MTYKTHDEAYHRGFLLTGDRRCYRCGELINEPIEQFGDTDRPFCMSCFLDPRTLTPSGKEAASDIEESINDIQDQIDDLEKEKMELEEQMTALLNHDGSTRKGEIEKFKKWYFSVTGIAYTPKGAK